MVPSLIESAKKGKFTVLARDKSEATCEEKDSLMSVSEDCVGGNPSNGPECCEHIVLINIPDSLSTIIC